MPIPDWGQADENVRRIGDLQSQITEAELQADTEIKAIRAELKQETQEKFDAIDLYLRSLEAFCDRHAEEFGKSRSKKLSSGRLGWRKSTSIQISPKKTLELLREFPAHIRKLCIRIKESVNKDGLAALTDEQLKTLKARREETDVFYVEPAVAEAVNNNET